MSNLTVSRRRFASPTATFPRWDGRINTPFRKRKNRFLFVTDYKKNWTKALQLQHTLQHNTHRRPLRSVFHMHVCVCVCWAVPNMTTRWRPRLKQLQERLLIGEHTHGGALSPWGASYLLQSPPTTSSRHCIGSFMREHCFLTPAGPIRGLLFSSLRVLFNFC